jgi:hypothetical protein
MRLRSLAQRSAAYAQMLHDFDEAIAKAGDKLSIATGAAVGSRREVQPDALPFGARQMVDCEVAYGHKRTQ